MEINRNYIGIDIGGTNTKIALVSEKGDISSLRRLVNKEVKLDLSNYLDLISHEIDQIKIENKLPIFGLGVSAPGLQMKNGHGTLVSINMPILNQFDLKGYFEEQYKIPVVVQNDLVAHSLAESFFGAGFGVERFLSVSLGTGIGHTFILNGVPQLSLGGVSGESGRMVLDTTSTDNDSMGSIGTAEAMCGVKAIEKLAEEKYLPGLAHTAHDVISATRENNDQVAIEIMSIIASRVAHLLVNLSAIYFPQVISLTGGQTEAGDIFIATCKSEYDKLSNAFFGDFMGLCGFRKEVKIVKSDMGGLTGLVGSIVSFLGRKT